jgi:hypothetical protein
MSTVHPSIEQHPDIMALRASYDRAAESMTMQGTFGLTFLTALYCVLSPWIVASMRPHGSRRTISLWVLRSHS